MHNVGRKMVALLLATSFGLGCFVVAVQADPTSVQNDMHLAIPTMDMSRYLINPEINKNGIDPSLIYIDAQSSQLKTNPPGDKYQVGDKASFFVGDDGKWWYNITDPTGFMQFTKRAEGNMSELWTADDMAFFDGDPRNSMTSLIEITDQQAEYMVKQFDDVIYPIVTGFAGPAPPRDGGNSIFKSMGLPYFGSNITGRVMIMVLNIYDGAYWYPDPDAHSIGGYYEPSTTSDYDRNIVHIDNWDWLNKTGLQSMLFSGNYSYQMESILAHEYQHVINDYYNPVQASFLSEGCSELASVLCGYGVNHSRYSNYVDFLAMPDNSLTEWLDQGGWGILADYAAGALFVIYLYDHFGPTLVHDLIATNHSGIDAVNHALISNGKTDWNFDRIFNNWRLANLIRSDSPGNGLYNYISIDLNDPDFGQLKTLEWDPTKRESINSAARFFGTTKTWFDGDTGISELGAYGTDYIHVQSGSPSFGPGNGWADGLDSFGLTFGFDGDDNTVQGWQIVKQPIGLKDSSAFEEDFDHGGEMPGWSTESLGELSHPWYIQHAANGDFFAVANAYELGWDIYPMMREVLYMTQGFSTIGYTELGLEVTMDCQMPWAWGSFGRIIYSVDGGLIWSELVNYSESKNQMGDVPFEYRTTIVLDISDACGYQDVRLAFDYSSYNPGYWWAVDDIRVGNLISEKMWWSSKGDQVDYKMTANLDLTGMTQAVLTFDTKWNIEYSWDFGFLQVSSDGGQNWTSVANEYTTYDAGYGAWPEIIINLPGITGQSPFPDFSPVSFDLSPWAGQLIKLRFRYITDWAATLDGWFVDNVRLNGRLLDNADNVQMFQSDIPPTDIDWLVTLYFPGCYGTDGVYRLPVIMNLHPMDIDEQTIRYIGSMVSYRDMYIIVSPTAGPSDYGFLFNN